MPTILIVPVADGDNFGPGYRINITTDTFGPFPVGSRFEVQLYGGATFEELVAQETYDTQEQSIDTQFQVHPDQWDAVDFLRLQGLINPGTELRLIARHFDGSNLDGQIPRQIKWDPTSGLTNVVQGSFGAVEGGFTTTDRATLNDTADQTLVQLPSNAAGAPLVSGLADWFTLSHGTQYLRGPVILLSGRGSLDPTAVGAPWAFGGTFSWFTVPAELGFDDGLVPHYHRVLLELGIIYADGGTDLYTDRRLAFQDDGHFVEWPMLRVPERIDYWVFPGVTVAWQFMRGAAGLTRVT